MRPARIFILIGACVWWLGQIVESASFIARNARSMARPRSRRLAHLAGGCWVVSHSMSRTAERIRSPSSTFRIRGMCQVHRLHRLALFRLLFS